MHGLFVKQRQRRNSVLNKETETLVLAYFEAHPRDSIRNACHELEMNYKTVRKVLHRFKYHAFKLIVHQTLLPSGEGRRIKFCGWILVMAANNSDFFLHHLDR